MIWDAPAWSLASPEFTHGFPKRLIVQEHGGFLPGNITVSAKASNLTLRRLAGCDVACLVSQATTAGSGLNRARLLNLRYAAISYQSGSFCPQYLASAMGEFGVNFATFEALSADTLDTLHASLKRGWRQGDDSYIHTYIRLLTTSPKGLFSANYKEKDKNKNIYKLFKVTIANH